MAEQKSIQDFNKELRDKAALEIMGLADTQRLTLTAVERILEDYDAARQS